MLRRQRSPRRLFEAFRKRGKLFLPDRQAGGILVAAELFQTVLAAAECLDHVKAADAARRALSHSLVETDDHRGTVKSLDDARGNDAEDTRMPTLLTQHQGIAIANLSARLLQRLL